LQLPHKLLPAQDDLIDDQLDKVNKYLDDQEDDFDEYQAATKKAIAELEEKKVAVEEKLSKYRQEDQDRAAERLGAAIPDVPVEVKREVKREDTQGDIDMQDVAKASGRPPVPEREEREESRAAGEEVEW
jgi:CRISPR/Cas system-associated exonuclease Cas4 (RecB family)